jgi:hypothetical protein
VETLSGQPAGRIRIQLPLEDYHGALHAHGEDLAVTFQGRLEREGNLTWLYDARSIAVHPADDERTRTVRASGQQIRGQMSIEEADGKARTAPPDETTLTRLVALAAARGARVVRPSPPAVARLRRSLPADVRSPASAGAWLDVGAGGYRPSCWYLASVASFWGFHHHSLARYQSMVAASPARKSP